MFYNKTRSYPLIYLFNNVFLCQLINAYYLSFTRDALFDGQLALAYAKYITQESDKLLLSSCQLITVSCAYPGTDDVVPFPSKVAILDV